MIPWMLFLQILLLTLVAYMLVGALITHYFNAKKGQ